MHGVLVVKGINKNRKRDKEEKQLSLKYYLFFSVLVAKPYIAGAGSTHAEYKAKKKSRWCHCLVEAKKKKK